MTFDPLDADPTSATTGSFLAAVQSGDVERVRRLAALRSDLVVRPHEGELAPLHAAVLQRNADMVQVLMELGADARTGIWPHRAATTAQCLARDRGDTRILQILEAAETRRIRSLGPSCDVVPGTEAFLQALRADRTDDARAMLSRSPELARSANPRGETPLHLAAATHDADFVARLLECGADPRAAAQIGGPPPLRLLPADYAALTAGWTMREDPNHRFGLLSNADKPRSSLMATLDALAEQGGPLTDRAAVALGRLEEIRARHDAGTLKNEIHPIRGGLLSIAVRTNQPDVLALLLDLGLDPDEAVMDEGAPISWGMPLWFCAVCGRSEMAELLLSRGADVDAIVFASGDAFSIAHTVGDSSFQSLLRSRGARLTVESINDLETARKVLSGELAAWSLNAQNPTPAELAGHLLWAAAAEHDNIVELCLPHVRYAEGDPWWRLVLIRASLQTCRVLLNWGVDPDVCGPDGLGMTQLHHIATEQTKDLQRVERARLFLSAGASLASRDRVLESTPLGWACRWGRRDLVELYLERGAPAVETDAPSWAQPEAWALRYDHRDLLPLLQSPRRP